MEWSLQSLIANIFIGAIVVLGYVYLRTTQDFDYWKKRRVPYKSPIFPFGNTKDLVFLREHAGKLYERFYKHFKGQRFCGIFEGSKPTLIVLELDLARKILTSDFSHFTDRFILPKFFHTALDRNLSSLEGQEWKEMRNRIISLFSTGKLKTMFDTIHKSCDKLKKQLKFFAETHKVEDVKDLMARFTIDTTASCIFGVSSNSLEDSNAEFYRLTKIMRSKPKYDSFQATIIDSFPTLTRVLTKIPKTTKISNFYLKFVSKIFEIRKMHGEYLLDVLLNNKKWTNEDYERFRKEDQFIKDAAAQFYILFSAGFEVSAEITSLVLYELARNQQVQKRLQKEVDDVLKRHGGVFCYEALKELTYMDQVINETIRTRRSNPALMRKVIKPYNIPDSDVILEKGIKVVIPTYAIHNDPDIYPNPTVFDPERFSKENIDRRHKYSFLPFGEGPRMCIGKRFGLVQIKMALTTVVESFELKEAEDTSTPEVSVASFVPMTEKPIALLFRERKETLS